ncbi:MAG: hypothetical protein ABI868_00900 [Acidobacteriota bacterium]
MVVGRGQIEQHCVAAAIEDDVAVPRALDDDGFVRRAVGGEIKRAVEQSRVRPRVAPPILSIRPGVNQDDIARLHTRLKRIDEIGAVRAGVVRRHQGVEARLQLRAGVIARIHVINRTARRGFRDRSRAGRDRSLDGRSARRRVRVRQPQPNVIRRVGFEVEHAAREHVRRHVMKGCALLHCFGLQPKQRQTVTPRRVAGPAPRHSDGRIAVVVALNAPLDADRLRRRQLEIDGARLRH